jgi:hypothetical protein
MADKYDNGLNIAKANAEFVATHCKTFSQFVAIDVNGIHQTHDYWEVHFNAERQPVFAMMVDNGLKYTYAIDGIEYTATGLIRQYYKIDMMIENRIRVMTYTEYEQPECNAWDYFDQWEGNERAELLGILKGLQSRKIDVIKWLERYGDK